VRLSDNAPEVDVAQQVLLDLTGERMRLSALLEWRCSHGTLYSPTAWAPAGWTVLRVEESPGGRPISFQTEPAEDGGVLVRLQLEKGLSAQETLRALVSAESSQGLLLPVDDAVDLTLPEIRAVDFAANQSSDYAFYLPPNLPFRRENLPTARRDAPPFAVGLPAPSNATPYFFRYTPPLKDATLTLLVEKPKFSVDHRHDVRWDGRRWTGTLSLDVTVERGLPQSIGLVCSTPTPPGLTWTTVGAVNSVEAFEPTAAAEAAAIGTNDYDLRFSGPLTGRLRVLGTWSSDEPSLEVPLFRLPAAERFLATVTVKGSTGERIDVTATGVAEIERETAVDAGDEPGVGDPALGDPSLDGAVGGDDRLWAGTYSRWPSEARLELQVHPAAADAEPIGVDQAVVRVRTLVEDRQLVQQVSLRLDCRRARPLDLRLPPESRLWYAVVDGAAIDPRLYDGRLQLTPRLAPGRHVVELLYAEPTPRSWGLPVARVLPPLVDWQTASFAWVVERYGAAAALPDEALASHGVVASVGRSTASAKSGDDGITFLGDARPNRG
ncbi:MAG: hypothetical protein ACRDD1_05285, partial [Planctomycetia bacterium]